MKTQRQNSSAPSSSKILQNVKKKNSEKYDDIAPYIYYGGSKQKEKLLSKTHVIRQLGFQTTVL